ncbi:unnamed protein product [Ceratitis capitata]|uniref:(Mediterranean fruit fly) hypothetical protein n=1 Tax=Ceratitis capitata TaxID=7213 RepID=A0A811U7R6_CERCA|nr:unnamed protein product [Ceratitis capitata]
MEANGENSSFRGSTRGVSNSVGQLIVNGVVTEGNATVNNVLVKPKLQSISWTEARQLCNAAAAAATTAAAVSCSNYCWGLATISKLSLSNWEIMWHFGTCNIQHIEVWQPANEHNERVAVLHATTSLPTRIVTNNAVSVRTIDK